MTRLTKKGKEDTRGKTFDYSTRRPQREWNPEYYYFEVMKYIEWYFSAHNKPPSIREINKALDMRSTNHVAMVLDKLEKDGYIKRGPQYKEGVWSARRVIQLTKKRLFI